MAVNDVTHNSIKKEVELFVESIRPPPRVRDRQDITFRIKSQTVEIAEECFVWHGRSGEKKQRKFARLTYAQSHDMWKLYRMRSNRKWDLYSQAPTLTAALNLVKVDTHRCFYK
jgi:hypothetical protein